MNVELPFSVGCLGLALNFNEVMALQRAFKSGRFKCSATSTMVTEAEFPYKGYALVVKKDVAGDFCLKCIRDFVVKNPSLRLVESENYLTICST